MTGWKRSSFCSTDHVTEQCVEVTSVFGGLPGDALLIRSSERPDQTVLVSDDEWRAFVAGVKAGEFDDLTPGGSTGGADVVSTDARPLHRPPPSVDLRHGDRSDAPCFGHHRFYPVERFPDGRVRHVCDNCPAEVVDDPAGTVVLSDRAVQSSGGGS